MNSISLRRKQQVPFYGENDDIADAFGAKERKTRAIIIEKPKQIKNTNGGENLRKEKDLKPEIIENPPVSNGNETNNEIIHKKKKKKIIIRKRIEEPNLVQEKPLVIENKKSNTLEGEEVAQKPMIIERNVQSDDDEKVKIKRKKQKIRQMPENPQIVSKFSIQLVHELEVLEPKKKIVADWESVDDMFLGIIKDTDDSYWMKKKYSK